MTITEKEKLLKSINEVEAWLQGEIEELTNKKKLKEYKKLYKKLNDLFDDLYNLYD